VEVTGKASRRLVDFAAHVPIAAAIVTTRASGNDVRLDVFR
jgi:hypothetical protein